MARRPSKSEIRRRVAARNAAPTLPEPLPTELETYLAEYEPRAISTEEWDDIRPVVTDWMRRYRPETNEATRQRLVASIAYLTWARARGYDLDLTLLTFDRIEAWTRNSTASQTTTTNYRSKLRGMARAIGPDTSTSRISVPHEKVKAPYSPGEVSEIERFACTQPTKTLGRQVAACVGLGLGAGVSSPDLRHLTVAMVCDHADDGIEVRLPDRTVWVRRRYEDLVRTGIAGVGRKRLVIGEDVDRRNIAGSVYARAEHRAQVVHVEQSRLRTTWLAALLQAHLPLAVIMRAAGLKSARTLTEIVAFLDEQLDDASTRQVR